MPKLTSKKRQELIDHLVGNCDCHEEDALFEEGDVATLNKMDLEQLEQLAANEEDDDDDGGDDTDYSDDSDDSDDVTANTITLADLPAEMQEDLKFAANMKRQQKDQLVARIIANADKKPNAKVLQSKSLDQLQEIADLVGNDLHKGEPAADTDVVEEDDEEAVAGAAAKLAAKKKRKAKRIGGHAADLATNASEFSEGLSPPSFELPRE